MTVDQFYLQVIRIVPVFVTLALGVGFVMVTRQMIESLKLRVAALNGTPEKVSVLINDLKSHRESTNREIEALRKEVEITRAQTDKQWDHLWEIMKRVEGQGHEDQSKGRSGRA